MARTVAIASNVDVRRRAWTETLVAGAAAGVAGGVAMAIWSMAYAAAVGLGAMMPLKLIGSTFRGADALVGGTGTVLWGLGVHVATAAVFGMLFSMRVPRAASVAGTFVGGVAYALGLLLVMTFVVMPAVDPTMFPRVALIPGAWFVGHVLFGAALALVPLLRERLAGLSLSARARTVLARQG
jgi:hypothetical protein